MRKIAIVGGVGHVGLPFGVVLASKGFKVFAYDISTSNVDLVNSGQFPFMESGGSNLLKDVLHNETFEATTNPEALTNAEIVILVIGTPVDEHLSPDPSAVIVHIKNILNYIANAKLLILRSTLFPGVSEKVLKLIKNVYPDLEVVYCPERILEGKAVDELTSLPQIIGADSDTAYLLAKEIFETLGIKTLRTTFEEAELAKLFTNVWRYLKFAAANQFWMMSNDLGIDYEKVREAITFEYPRAQDLPSAGFSAGPCLFKDTMQLSALVKQNFPLGNSAMMINEGIPGYLIAKLKQKHDLSQLRVGILGMAFKADVDDNRSSLAYKLRKLLDFDCLEVRCTDPYVRDNRLVDLDTVLEKSDLLIIGAPHTLYKELKFHKPVIDIWNLFGDGVLV
jgi:UDP-N-acetyl-D-mannosaminuronic acid dehydrogenase